ncbi:uncharacterized protein METZ01_LOCUS191803 [marine metagenome]|uniref:Uncharacterized protein n=1 Tax=marine metagenome TaxID=408172 RepID=A0A382DL64_9ZZZZ
MVSHLSKREGGALLQFAARVAYEPVIAV